MRRRLFLASCCFLLGTVSSFAQVPQPFPRIEVTGSGASTTSWDTIAGRSYFLQWSPDLATWQYVPMLELGDGNSLSFGTQSNTSNFFTRLRYTDQDFTGSVYDADFDGDGISNWNEIREPSSSQSIQLPEGVMEAQSSTASGGGSGTDPLAADSDGDGKSDYHEDSNGNGAADGWEFDHYGELGEVDPNADPDDDGLTNLEESLLGTDPSLKNTDGDDFDDGEDAMPTDEELNWAKTPERRYALVDLGVSEGQVIAVNKRGDVLTSEKFWSASSGNWETLPESPIIEEEERYEEVRTGYTDLSDDGTVVGSHDYAYYDPNFSTGYFINEKTIPFTWKSGEPSINQLTDMPAPACAIGNESDSNASLRVAGEGEVHFGVLWRYRDILSYNPDSACEPLESFDFDLYDEYDYKALAKWVDGVPQLLSAYDDTSIKVLGVSNDQSVLWSSDPGMYSVETVESVRLDNTIIASAPFPKGRPISICKVKYPKMNAPLLGGNKSLWVKGSSGWEVKDLYHDLAKTREISGSVQFISDDGTILTSSGFLWRNGETVGLSQSINNSSFPFIWNDKMSTNGLIAGESTMVEDGEIHTVLLLPVDLVPDYNRDGKIDSKDRGKITEENPFHWWVNDDNDKAIVNGRGKNLDDVPGQEIDNSDTVVNGLRDLIDFFPLHLDLETALKTFPREQFKYLIKHEEAAFQFIEVPGVTLDGSVKGQEVNSHILDWTRAQILSAYNVRPMGSNSDLGAGLLDAAADGKGVIFVECIKPTDKPIILEIQTNSGTKIAELEFPIETSPVEDMYRHVNLRSLRGGSGGHYTQIDEPENYPDALTSDSYVAYVHGYNISGTQSRGSQSNIFKRLHQLGSKARYVGVSWYGDPPNPGVNLVLPPDYHRAVFNGLQTGSILHTNLGLGFTQDTKLTILAHSLGNSVVSHAIANNFLKADHYFMINGAMPIEAYDSSQTSNSSGHPSMERNMTEDDWKPYFDHYGQKRLFASHWHTLFDASDHRSKLTWKDFFAKDEVLGIAYNFYSPSDHVVENPNETEEFGDLINLWVSGTESGRHAWVSQEIVKGGQNAIALTAFHELNGGWLRAHEYRFYPPLQAHTQLSNESLKEKPFFSKFLYEDLHDPQKGSQTAALPSVRDKILATGVPASSYAIAVNALTKLEDFGEGRNFNMPSGFKNPEAPWPEHPDSNDPGDWMHGDFKDVAFPYVYPMFERIIGLAELKK